MLEALTILFACQLAGETLVRLAAVDFPGPVLGMALLVAGLIVAGRSGPALDGVADGFLKNLSLLFVPAAVGVIQQAEIIAANWVALTASLVGSAVLTLTVTVTVFRLVARAGRRP